MIDPLLPSLTAFGVACGLSAALTPAARRLALSLGALDEPDDRKIHTTPVPRLGGLAVVPALIVGAGLVLAFEPALRSAVSEVSGRWAVLLLASLAVAGLGVADDLRPIPAGFKFPFQFAAALAVLQFAVPLRAIDLSPFGPPVAVGPLMNVIGALWIVTVTNAFNMSDGIDGLASGLGAIAAAALALVSWQLGATVGVVVLAATAGALLGFLPYNFRPARIFLGDSGSLGVGFLLGAVSLVGLQQRGAWLAFPAALALAIPLVDCSFAVLRRAWQAVSVVRRSGRRERFEFAKNGWPTFFTADKRHIHHRLLDLGLPPGGAVLALCTIAAALGALAVATVRWPWVGPVAGFAFIAASAYFAPKWLYDELRFLQKGALLPLFEHPLIRSRAFHAVFDACAVAASYLAARVLVQGTGPTLAEGWPLLLKTAVIAGATVLGLWLAGLYRVAYRHAGLSEVLKVARAVVFGIVLGAGARILLFAPPVRFAVWVVLLYLTLTALLAARLSFRLLDHIYQRARQVGRRVLIYGAGRAGSLALREILSNPDLGLTPVGFVDDEPTLWGRSFDGYPIHPGGSHLESLLFALDVEDLVISTKKMEPARLQEITSQCGDKGVRVLQFSLLWHESGRAHFEEVAESPPAGIRVPKAVPGP